MRLFPVLLGFLLILGKNSFADIRLHGNWACFSNGTYFELWFDDTDKYLIDLDFNRYLSNSIYRYEVKNDTIFFVDFPLTFYPFRFINDSTLELHYDNDYADTLRRFSNYKFEFNQEFDVEGFEELAQLQANYPNLPELERAELDSLDEKLYQYMLFRENLFYLYFGDEFKEEFLTRVALFILDDLINDFSSPFYPAYMEVRDKLGKSLEEFLKSR